MNIEILIIMKVKLCYIQKNIKQLHVILIMPSDKIK